MSCDLCRQKGGNCVAKIRTDRQREQLSPLFLSLLLPWPSCMLTYPLIWLTFECVFAQKRLPSFRNNNMRREITLCRFLPFLVLWHHPLSPTIRDHLQLLQLHNRKVPGDVGNEIRESGMMATKSLLPVSHPHIRATDRSPAVTYSYSNPDATSLLAGKSLTFCMFTQILWGIRRSSFPQIKRQIQKKKIFPWHHLMNPTGFSGQSSSSNRLCLRETRRSCSQFLGFFLRSVFLSLLYDVVIFLWLVNLSFSTLALRHAKQQKTRSKMWEDTMERKIQ